MPSRTLKELNTHAQRAVAHYWQTRTKQRSRQEQSGKADQGFRSAVTGGAQMDGFVDLFANLITDAGIPPECIHRNSAVELPGYFRPTKEWDLLVIRDRTLIAAIEAKSQVGPSFGKSFNNHTEEAVGRAVDVWDAYRQGMFATGYQPFVGYLFMLEDCAATRRPIPVPKTHYPVRPEFHRSSHMENYESFCRKLIFERHFSATAFITSSRTTGRLGQYETPSEDVSLMRFARILGGLVTGAS